MARPRMILQAGTGKKPRVSLAKGGKKTTSRKYACGGRIKRK